MPYLARVIKIEEGKGKVYELRCGAERVRLCCWLGADKRMGKPLKDLSLTQACLLMLGAGQQQLSCEKSIL